MDTPAVVNRRRGKLPAQRLSRRDARRCGMAGARGEPVCRPGAGRRRAHRAGMRADPARVEVLRLGEYNTPVALIAGRTQLSSGTMRNYLAAAVAELGVTSRAEAFRTPRQRMGITPTWPLNSLRRDARHRSPTQRPARRRSAPMAHQSRWPQIGNKQPSARGKGGMAYHDQTSTTPGCPGPQGPAVGGICTWLWHLRGPVRNALPGGPTRAWLMSSP